MKPPWKIDEPLARAAEARVVREIDGLAIIARPVASRWKPVCQIP